ncbi:uncharacterized protein LOC126657567 [Mercurialis annua]|uniref:uncharacterized protein LOC126657567 n=1 Tax=Mercurialis annua TaxID=3986 RepID=UPI00215E85BF|nr:uncharacterized protein LOC126657567 [Mercurialis annua]
MMNNYPYYTNQFTYPHYSSRIPVETKTTPQPPRKVVTIAVSDGSERPPPPVPNKSDCAVKIQKVFRGFLVRKSVKKISEIRNEVDEIEKLLATEEQIEVMRNDSKERLKVSEMIMRLLLRLDSVRGVDCGVKDLRKSVIKKAIRLQEIVDSVVLNSNNNNLIGDDQTADAPRQEAEEEEVINGVNSDSDSVKKNAEPEIMEMSQADSTMEINEAEKEEGEVNSCDGEDKEVVPAEENGGGGRSGELMEKMKEDNEKMMELMGKLFERNEMQTRMLSSLTQRVEQLERVLVCERTKRNKKKKRNSGGIADFFESNQNCKKFGKR